MPRDQVSYLNDMMDAGKAILKFTEGMDQEDYLASELTRAAVERKFTIIGEALNQLLRLHPELRGKIREEKNVVAFRNRVIHGHFAVDELLVWSAIKSDLPTLMSDVAGMLGELEN